MLPLSHTLTLLMCKTYVAFLCDLNECWFLNKSPFLLSSVFFPFSFFSKSKRRSQGLSLDSIYHCLNRTILYQLSRPHKTVPQQVTLLDSLRVLTVNRNLVLGPGNHDQEFVACLAHCLINLHTGRWERHIEAVWCFQALYVKARVYEYWVNILTC